MPRKRVTRLFPVALSPAALAEALTIPVAIIRDAIADASLPCHDIRNRRRVLVRDAEAWVKRWPRSVIRKRLASLR